MFKEEEEKLARIKEQYQDVKIPEQIDEYILAGIGQAKKSKKRWRTSTFSTIAAGILVFLLLASIRVSPAFANYVSQVPGLERLVAFVQGDKGLEAAVQNDFVQEIGKSDTHDGLTLMVDKIIADETRILVFYTLVSARDIGSINYGKVSILNGKNEKIMGSLSYDTPIEGLKSGEKYEGTLDIGLDKDKPAPEKIKLGIGMEVMYANAKAEVLNSEWRVEFEVEQEKFYGNKQVYGVNQTVDVEGQRITVKEVIVYPTRIGVHVKYDKNNTKEIFHFDDLKVVNEKGEEWASIKNGTTAQGVSEQEEIVYLQSNYFTKPKELYLEFSSIRALDKDKLDVKIDLEQKKLLKKPNDQLEFVEATKEGNKISVELSLKSKSKFDIDHGYETFGMGYNDNVGNEYKVLDGMGSTPYDESLRSELFFSVENIDYHGPITFKITDYPTRITKDIRIKVK